MATNPYVNKVALNGTTLLDLTGDTAVASDVAQGKTFHLATGEQVAGTASGGGTQNMWYGTSSTAASTQTKAVTTSTADFVLAAGNSVRVKFTNAQTYSGGIKLNVDDTGAVNVMRVGTTVTVRYFFLAGEIVDFVYDGTNFVAVNEGIATTTYYGTTKLSSATNSTSTSLAATPSAVKAAYDLANGKQDALVSGTNIKTINGNSLLGSGDITVSGGGGGTIATTATATLTAAGWSNNTQTVSVAGVSAANVVIVTYAPASKSAWTAADIYCSAQGSGTLTFTCAITPTVAINANVLILTGGGLAQIITFDILEIPYAYDAEEGMTWTQWVNSTYNTDGYVIVDGRIYNSTRTKYIADQTPSSVIVAGALYRFTSGGGND